MAGMRLPLNIHRGKETQTLLLRYLLTPENLWALLLCLIILALIIFTADSAPLWIYQGF